VDLPVAVVPRQKIAVKDCNAKLIVSLFEEILGKERNGEHGVLINNFLNLANLIANRNQGEFEAFFELYLLYACLCKYEMLNFQLTIGDTSFSEKISEFLKGSIHFRPNVSISFLSGVSISLYPDLILFCYPYRIGKTSDLSKYASSVFYDLSNKLMANLVRGEDFHFLNYGGFEAKNKEFSRIKKLFQIEVEHEFTDFEIFLASPKQMLIYMLLKNALPKDLVNYFFSLMIAYNRQKLTGALLLERINRIRGREDELKKLTVLEDISGLISTIEKLKDTLFTVKFDCVKISGNDNIKVNFHANNKNINDFIFFIKYRINGLSVIEIENGVMFTIPLDVIETFKDCLRQLTCPSELRADYDIISYVSAQLELSGPVFLSKTPVFSSAEFFDVALKIQSKDDPDIIILSFHKIVGYLQNLKVPMDCILDLFCHNRQLVIDNISQHFIVGDNGLKLEDLYPIKIIGNYIAGVAFEMLEKLFEVVQKMEYPDKGVFPFSSSPTQGAHVALLKNCYYHILSHLFNEQNAECKAFYYDVAKKSNLMKGDEGVQKLLRDYEVQLKIDSASSCSKRR